MDLLSVPETIYKAIVNLANANQTKKVILDPMSTIVRLAILAFLPQGTKIGIYRNQIVFYPPDKLQGLSRFMYGDKRIDLYNLYQPIVLARKWYVDSEEITNKMELNKDKLKYIFELAHQGLTKLKDNYSSKFTNFDNQTHMSLSIYDNILTGKQQDIPDEASNERSQALAKEADESQNIPIRSKLKQLWNDADIDAVYAQFKSMNKDMEPSLIDKHVNVIKTHLKIKDDTVEAIVTENATNL